MPWHVSGVTVTVRSKEGEAVIKLDKKKVGRVPHIGNMPKEDPPQVQGASALQPLLHCFWEIVHVVMNFLLLL